MMTRRLFLQSATNVLTSMTTLVRKVTNSEHWANVMFQAQEITKITCTYIYMRHAALGTAKQNLAFIVVTEIGVNLSRLGAGELSCKTNGALVKVKVRYLRMKFVDCHN